MVAAPPPIASGRSQPRPSQHPPTTTATTPSHHPHPTNKQHSPHSPQRQQSSAASSSPVSSTQLASARSSGGSRRPHGLFGPYKLSRTLGEGEFGKVKLATHTETGKQVAIKLIKKENIEQPNRRAKLMREISLLQAVDHPFIVTVYEVIETRDYIGMIMEYASGGELFEHILAHRYLKERDACRFFAQLLAGVAYLHGRQIVHRDLKLENLLLDGQRNVIITDFGFANRSSINPEQLLLTSCGSPCYAAPELVISDGYVGEAADIWSCGVILYAMLCGYLPFDDDPNNPDGDNINLLYKYILETELDFPDYVGADARELLKRMLVPDPRFRANMKEIMNHRWLEPFRHFYKEEETKLFGGDRSKTPITKGDLYDTPPATPPSGMRVPEVEMGLEDTVRTDSAMEVDAPAAHKHSAAAANQAGDEGRVPQMLAPTSPGPSESTRLPPSPLRQSMDVSDTDAVVPVHDDDDHPLAQSISSNRMSAVIVIDEVVVNPDTPMDLSDSALSEADDVSAPASADITNASSRNSSLDAPIALDTAEKRDPSSTSSLPKDPTLVYGIPTSVAHSAAASTPNLVRALSQRNPGADPRTVVFHSSAELTTQPGSDDAADPVDDAPVPPPRRIDYGRKSFDVRRTESSASRKSMFGWMKKSGYPPSPAVQIPLSLTPPPRDDGDPSTPRPHSAVDTDRPVNGPTAPPRTSVNAPSVMSTASEWTIAQPNGTGQKVKLRYHSGPIDQRALSSKAPNLILSDVRGVIEEMGMTIVGSDGFKMRVVRTAQLALQQRLQQQQMQRQMLLDQQQLPQQEEGHQDHVLASSPHGPIVQPHRTPASASDMSFVNGAPVLPPSAQPNSHPHHGGAPPPVAFERRSIAHILASFPVSLVKKLKNVARYGSGYNKGFGKADAAAIYSHHHYGGSTATLGNHSNNGSGHMPYYSHANSSTASRESFATYIHPNPSNVHHHNINSSSSSSINNGNNNHNSGTYSTHHGNGSRFYTHHNNSSMISQQQPPLAEGEIRFTVEVQRIKNLPGLFVVEFKRARGDVWEFKRVYNEVVESCSGLGRVGM
ncbi:hypothetical protein DFJ77DRAFT_244216 [Powellomyces hirtus]|nr:hypothetical protein DFJ77DRAFT_244216 [Powellomyces hirtus]